jgi:hypothetical protein
VDKKQKKILIWLLTWAGLLVAVLYSPVGSPDLYSPMHYYSANQGVMFNGADIVNAPTNGSAGSGRQSFSITPDNPDLLKNGSAYVIVNSDQAVSRQNGATAMTTPAGNGNRGGGGTANDGDFAMSARKSKSSNSSNTATNGVVAMNTDFTAFSSKQQSNNYTPFTGATDPGDVVTGPPIPVGDGWIFLLLLAIGYAGWKKFRF